MKKLLLAFVLCFYSLVSYADIPKIELDGVSAVNLSRYNYNALGVYGISSGAFSSGQCSIVIRTAGSSSNFAALAKALKFTRTLGGSTPAEIVPVVTNYGLIIMLTKTDFGMETINLETRNGRSIAFALSEIFPNESVEVMTGVCYPPNTAA